MAKAWVRAAATAVITLATACFSSGDITTGTPGLGETTDTATSGGSVDGSSEGVTSDDVTTDPSASSGMSSSQTASSDSGTSVGPECGGLQCDANASCEGDACVCNAGFEGDGESCADIDGCADGPCADAVQCTDEPAPGDGYSCGTCPPGTEGDGMVCSEVDGCADTPCFAGVACTDVPAPGEGFMCGPCPAGYEGDGQSCTDIDGCAPAPCYPGVACTDVPAPGTGFSCGACPLGFAGDGVECFSVSTFVIGDTPNSFNAGPYFRGNGYVADADGWLDEFEVIIDLPAACTIDYYVFDAPVAGGTLTQLWRQSVAFGASNGYHPSGNINLPVTNGRYYLLGIGWNCQAIYYWHSAGAWAGFDTGIGIFTDNRWDNAYPGASDAYTPPNQGTSSTAYPHRVHWAE